MTLKYTLVPKEEQYDDIHLGELSKKYGEDIAKNDFQVKMLLLYPEAQLFDKNGRKVIMNDKVIRKVYEVNNRLLQQEANGTFVDKARRKLGLDSTPIKELSEIDFVPIIFDHNTGKVDNTCGFTRGSFELGEIDGHTVMYATALIKDDEVKYKIKKNLISNVSAGIRGDSSLKEISLVLRGALKHSTFLSEGSSVIQMSERDALFLELSECVHDINDKEFQLSELKKEFRIEKKLDNLVRCGKMLPKSVDYVKSQLMNLSEDESKDMLSVLELSTPQFELGAAYNRNYNFEVLGDMLMSTEQKALAATLEKLNAKTKRNYVKKTVQLSESMPSEAAAKMPIDGNKISLSQEEHKAKMKHIKELMEKDKKDGSNLAEKELKKELGEEEPDELGEDDKEKKLSEQFTALSDRIDTLTTELAESKNSQTQILEALNKLTEGAE